MIRSLPLSVLKHPTKVGTLYASQLCDPCRDSSVALPSTFRFMSFHDSDRRAKEIKLFAQTILQMTQEREVQARFAAGSENDKGRRTHARLRDVLHVQARTTVSLRGDDAAAFDHALVKLIQLRSRYATAARFVGADRERQKLPHALANQRRDRHDRRPA